MIVELILSCFNLIYVMFDKSKLLLSFGNKKNLSIVITDSGMGGLSICAEIAEKLKKNSSFEEINITYFNAWPEQGRGYNRLESDAERVRVFNEALKSMVKFEPDIILVACNTLSVLYNQTEFSKKTDIPVLDIVDFGVSMIKEKLSQSKDSAVLITGTLTTIESQEHKKRLIQDGIPEDRIFAQHCDQLATSIENGPDSENTQALIEKYMLEGSKKIPSHFNNVYLALCCTHFGYSCEYIAECMKKEIGKEILVLNPNNAMAEYLTGLFERNEYSLAKVNIKVVSRIKWDHGKVGSISGILEKISPITANSLRVYSWLPELFSF